MFLKKWLDSRGDSPVDKFIAELDLKPRVKILRVLSLVEENGIAIGPPVLEKMPGTMPSIHEIRKRYQGYIRIFCYFDSHNLWLMHAIHKKTGKTPRSDIELAEARARQIISTNQN